MKEFIYWIKLFFILRDQKKHSPSRKSINHYSKEFANSCSRAFGYKTQNSEILKYAVEELLYEIEKYHWRNNTSKECVEEYGMFKLDVLNYEFEEYSARNQNVLSKEILKKIKLSYENK
jgi:hypothetical protein